MMLASRANLFVFSLLASAAITAAAPRPIAVPPLLPPSSFADSNARVPGDGRPLIAASPHRRHSSSNLNNDTLNGLLDGSPCRPLTVVFARGTLEAGNVGTFAGPPFFQALASRVGDVNVSVQGADYPAVSEGFFSGGDPGGSQTMANLVLQVKQKCPQTKLILSGYSQGGQLVHNAAKILGPQGMISAVSAAVTFGDPYNSAPVPGLPSGDTMIFCHNGDDICKGGEQLFDPHFTYNRDAGKAADFVLLITKLSPASNTAGLRNGTRLPFIQELSKPKNVSQTNATRSPLSDGPIMKNTHRR
ncbi:hypothetical protein RB601_008247 [Gaeumannomyces tritici]